MANKLCLAILFMLYVMITLVVLSIAVPLSGLLVMIDRIRKGGGESRLSVES